MKKSIIIILIIAAVCIAYGAYGLSKSDSDSDSSIESSESPTGPFDVESSMKKDSGKDSKRDSPKNTGKKTSANGEKWLTVKIPDNLPSVLKDYEGFTLSFNPETHCPNWVGWELLGEETQGSQTRNNQFWQDTEVPGCPTTKDYSRSNYDRGHMCPAADQKWSAQAMTDCFSLTNMCPQKHELNAGAWNTLENKSRNWARRDSAILIISGPIFESKNVKTIGEMGVAVPDAFFKVIAAPFADQPRGIAFVYPNSNSPGNMEQYALTIDEVEELTGYDFFSSMPKNLQNKIESTASYKLWNHR
ncbi:MAG: DNA/RNA non-specific endonuclease [Muribaculaceae bacterium]|nr:DNA/RNA non-specific endonuclease [Muribaculaceae bacterium]